MVTLPPKMMSRIIQPLQRLFELDMAYKWDSIELGVSSRHNFSTNKGFIEVGLTFPQWGKLRGYATASDDYGERLIDYNYCQTLFGLGITLNNVI
jgi:phospholipase A1